MEFRTTFSSISFMVIGQFKFSVYLKTGIYCLFHKYLLAELILKSIFMMYILTEKQTIPQRFF